MAKSVRLEYIRSEHGGGVSGRQIIKCIESAEVAALTDKSAGASAGPPPGVFHVESRCRSVPSRHGLRFIYLVYLVGGRLARTTWTRSSAVQWLLRAQSTRRTWTTRAVLYEAGGGAAAEPRADEAALDP